MPASAIFLHLTQFLRTVHQIHVVVIITYNSLYMINKQD